MTPEDKEVQGALETAWSFHLPPKVLVEMVERKQALSAALEVLATLPRNLLVRWSDPNYG